MRLTIGITGHRDIIEIIELKQEIREYLQNLISQHNNKEIVLLSPLADGADRLVADIFLGLKERDNNLKLVVPMPFNQERYMQDFDLESQQEFLDYLDRAYDVFEVTDTQNDGYRSVGVFVADESDILLALWDGTDNHKAGGTADIVKYAKSKGKIVKHLLSQRGGSK
jgi:uncharacterized phage-like protein YoqJ